MAHATTPEGAERLVWAYAYRIESPRPEAQLGDVRRLLEREQAEAGLGTRVWQARLVLDALVTHVLVVSDDPAQDRHVNRCVEAELKRLHASFSITAPLAIPHASASPGDAPLKAS